MSKEKPSFTSKDVEIMNVLPLYDGFFKMVHYEFRHKLFAGGWSDLVRREIFERGHAVAVLPYDPIRQEFVLIEQVRIGALATSEYPWLMEVVAGIIDEGETEESVCHREAMEEAGITLTHLTKATSYLASPGGTTERIHIYVACTDATQAEGIHGLDYESEDIRVHRVSEDEALQWLESGRIDNAATIIALQWFFMHKQRLMEQWHSSESD
ncbi:ADP-ribose diphosphatase [Alteromonas aestuariivivens]|uniref:ADP-ribose pyrophosphatase n=1 Tax=Alteromonas aestuariivivens TaxID=1938339 RepID=A0A3D8MBT9_9ALTE|nr:ADP-ribose diphosphatase [Alteromonas aestuariivivens]RDV27974.1 ADP-ribose diphosphatase [Alteromonas aestuariivivens]